MVMLSFTLKNIPGTIQVLQQYYHSTTADEVPPPTEIYIIDPYIYVVVAEGLSY